MSTYPISPFSRSNKVVLVDDEPNARNVLRSFIQDFCPKLKVVGEAGGVAEGIQMIRQVSPDLVFLDVEMRDGQGFDLLDKFSKPNFRVIFTTAHDKFAFRAFKYYAIDYLLKPIDPTELVDAVEKLNQLQSENGLIQLLKAMQPHPQEKIFNKLALPSIDGLTMMNIKDIVRLEADAGYTTFYSLQGERVLVTRSIGEFEEVLPPETFFRVHVSHLVNLEFVKKYMREDGGQALMENGDQVPIARRRKEEFLDLLKSKSAF